MISIWFFIGISLAVNGALILGCGNLPVGESSSESRRGALHLHANVWWGAVLLVFGLVYCFKFAPRRQVLRCAGIHGMGSIMPTEKDDNGR